MVTPVSSKEALILESRFNSVIDIARGVKAGLIGEGHPLEASLLSAAGNKGGAGAIGTFLALPSTGAGCGTFGSSDNDKKDVIAGEGGEQRENVSEFSEEWNVKSENTSSPISGNFGSKVSGGSNEDF